MTTNDTNTNNSNISTNDTFEQQQDFLDIQQILSNQILYRKSQEIQFMIFKQLQNKNYKLIKFLTSSAKGNTDIIEGRKSNDINQNVVFKISNTENQEDFDKEIKILSSFEKDKDSNTNKDINIINMFDHFKIYDKTYQYNILVLEKCEYSLQDELKSPTQINLKNLFKITFECLDGLNQLKLNKIVHADIKPQNILKNILKKFCIADFDCAFKKIDLYSRKYQNFTFYFAPPEQLDQNQIHRMGFRSDIYSMGKTLLLVLNAYKPNHSLQNIKIIENYKTIIQDYMILDIIQSRKDCLFIHQKFLENSIEFLKSSNENREYHEKYLESIEQILNNIPSHHSKNRKYIKKYKEHYLLIQLMILELLKQLISLQNCQYNICQYYKELGEYQKALIYIINALQTNEIVNDEQQKNKFTLTKNEITDLTKQVNITEDQGQLQANSNFSQNYYQINDSLAYVGNQFFGSDSEEMYGINQSD